MRFNLNLELRAIYSAHNIEKILAQAINNGYDRFSSRNIDATQEFELNLSSALQFLMHGYKENEEQFLPMLILHSTKNNIVKTLWVYNHNDQISIHSGTMGYADGDYGSLKRDISTYLKLVKNFRISKFRLANEYNVDMPLNYYKQITDPIIGVVGPHMDHSSDRKILLDNIQDAGYNCSAPRRFDCSAIDCTSYVLTNGKNAELEIHDGSTFWFLPKKPYRMQRYDDEVAIDTTFYFEIVLDLCKNLEIWIIESHAFDAAN